MKILVVDDEVRMAKVVGGALREAGHFVKTTESANEALETLQGEDFDLLITDLRMPNIDGLVLLKRAKEIIPEISVVIMTAYASVDTAIEALRNGAEDYLIKPFSIDELLIRISRLEEKKRLKFELDLRRSAERGRFGQIVGKSKPIREVLELIDKVAATDATVLIYGPSGSGKELVARAIHEKSKRRDEPFVPINCAAITETLLESELFGYEKGAFTGATKSKPGRFELAHGGTLFLDEIGELPLSVQVKLLRVIQEREIYRVGGIQPIKVDVRIIAATNRDLKKAMAEGRFREDLYFRIAVFPIRVPPLSEHKEDIPELVEAFLARYNMSLADVDKDVIDTLMEYDWPGNVRELENLIERAIILSGGKRITLDHIPLVPAGETRDEDDSPTGTLMALERELLVKTLEQFKGNKTKAAKALGITRRMLYTRLKKFGLE
jgi:DNA-binding NtrC family response regulator